MHVSEEINNKIANIRYVPVERFVLDNMEEHNMWKKIVSGMLITTMLLACVGCSSNGIPNSKETIRNTPIEEVKNTDVIKIGETTVKLDYMYLYVIQFLYTYTMENGGSVADNMETYKDQIISQLRTDEIHYQYAKNNGIELTEEEMAEMDEVVDRYYETFSEEFLESYGISRDTVVDLFYKQRYITKLNDKATNDLVEEYKVEAEEQLKGAEFYQLYYLLFPTVEYDGNGAPMVDEDGNTIAVTASKKKEQLSLAEEAKGKLEDGADPVALATEYGITEYSDEIRSYKGAYTGAIEDLIADLKNGDVSEVYEDSLGYMVVKMLNTNDTEYRDYYIETISSNRASTGLQQKQQEWLTTVEVDTANDMIGMVWEYLDITKIYDDMDDRGYIIE